MQECLPRRRRCLSGVGIVLLLAAAVRADSSPVDPFPPRDSSTMPGSEARVARATVSEYWIGVQCRPVDKALRAQLELPPRQGLVVEEVVSDSPADKAGVRPCDVLVAADGEALKSIEDLVQGIEAAKDKELSLELIRGGERKRLEAKPARRPERLQPKQSSSQLSELEMLRKWLRDRQAGNSLRFRFFRPGMILPPDAPAHPPLPDDVTITVVKQGGELAQVIVTRDGETWKAAENQLDKLPEDLRPYAEQMIGTVRPGSSNPVQFFDFIPGEDNRLPSDATGLAAPHPDAAFENRLEAMNRQLDQLRHSLEQLREQQPSTPAEK